MKERWIKYRGELISLAVLFVVVTGILYMVFDWGHVSLSMPIEYAGGDDFSLYKYARMMMDGSFWNFSTDRLGAPFGAEFYDFLPDCLQNTDLVILKFFTLFSRNPIVVANLFVFFLFFAIAGTAYYALREFRVSREYAVLGAVIFDFMYYHFVRMLGHYCLGAYELVPLSVLLCVWLWQDKRFFCWNRDFFKYYKNVLGLIFLILIANNGIAYYPFFTCMFLGLAGISVALKTKKMAPVWKMLRMIVVVVVTMILAMLPSIVYQIQNGSLITQRSIGDSEIYALKIIQMLVPYKSYGIEKLDTLWSEYYKVFTFSEAYSSYLGLFAGLGFVLLLFGVLWKQSSNKPSDSGGIFRLFVELNVFAVIFGTVGGFSSIFFNFVVGLLRGVNRISIFIAFLSVAALCLVLTELAEKKCVKFRWARPVLFTFTLVVAGFSLKDQIPEGMTNSVAVNTEMQRSDYKFVHEMEKQLPEGAMIYQMPYHPFPEGGPVKDMADYHLLTGYIFSRDLRWSYGGSKGREADLWNKSVASLEVEELIPVLKEKGFAGIYIDRRAYDDVIFENIYNRINVILGYEPLKSENENLCFYKF